MVNDSRFSLSDVSLIPVHRILDDRGSMTVVTDGMVPFAIKRIFSISAIDSNRGHHAHKACQQFIVCLAGCLEVYVTNGIAKEQFSLDVTSDGLLIPSGIWSHQEYSSKATLVNVYCNLDYDEQDYIREYEEYLKYSCL